MLYRMLLRLLVRRFRSGKAKHLFPSSCPSVRQSACITVTSAGRVSVKCDTEDFMTISLEITNLVTDGQMYQSRYTKTHLRLDDDCTTLNVLLLLTVKLS